MSAPVITPAAATLDGKEVQLFTADQPCVWTTDAGVLYTNAGATSAYGGGLSTQVYLKAANVSGGYTLTATNGSAEADVAPVTVEGVCPAHPSWGFRGGYAPTFLQFIPDSGPADRQERTKRGPKYRCDLQAGTRQAAELEEFIEFHANHYGVNKNFKFTHPGRGVTFTCYFDAPLEEEWRLNNLVGYSTVVREV